MAASLMLGDQTDARLAVDFIDEGLGQADVVHVRVGVHVRLEDADLVLVGVHPAGNLALRVVEVTDHPRAAHAAFHAGRQQPELQAVLAEGALVGGLGLVVDEARVVRAGLHAVAAAHAAFVVDQHDAVGALEGRLHRADRHTRRLVAVVAQARQVDQRRGRIRRLGDFVLQHRGAELADRRQVLHRTAHRAGLTADAFAQIDQHAVALALHARATGRLVADAGLGGARQGQQAYSGTQAQQVLEQAAPAGRKRFIRFAHGVSSQALLKHSGSLNSWAFGSGRRLADDAFQPVSQTGAR